MALLKRYVAYYKDNPKGLWFKRKLYGWGWMPVKWQGWLAVALYVALIAVGEVKFIDAAETNVLNDSDVSLFIFFVIVITAALIGLCYLKGESPRWQWGTRRK